MRLFCVTIIACLALTPPLAAGETAWQELAPGVSVRLISAGTLDARGKGLFALEIDMPESTKTYWRIPGETGLPTELDFSGSTGVAGHAPHWPMPLRDTTDGYLDFVYFGHTVLPIELDISNPAGTVDLKATLGICSDICVPAQARLVLPASETKPDTASALRIRQALADVPLVWEEGPEPAGHVMLEADGSAIAVEIDPSVVDPDSLIVAGDIDGPLFGAPQKSPQDTLVVLPIMGKTDNSTLDGMQVDLSFMTPMGAFAVTRTIEAGADASGKARDQ